MSLQPNYRVIAFDPGRTTGWAAYSALYIPGTTVEYFSETYTMGQLGPEDHHVRLNQLLGMQRVQNYTVVCERFEDRPAGTTSVDLKAKEYVGTIETFCEEEDVPLFRQMPAAAKGFVKDENLRRLGIYHGKRWKHAMDGQRHVLWYLINGGPRRLDILKKGWPNE